MHKQPLIATIFCTILLMGSVSADQHGRFSPPKIDELLGSSILDSSSLRMFIKLISGARDDGPRTHKAKARAIRLFSTIYHQASEPIKEVLHDFVDHLSLIVRNRGFLSSTKSKRLMLLLEETKFLLHQAVKKHGQSIKKDDVDRLMESVYMVVNPTLGDFWRKARRYSVYAGGTALLAYLIFSGNLLRRISNTFDFFAGKEGPMRSVAKLASDSSRATTAMRKHNLHQALTQAEKDIHTFKYNPGTHTLEKLLSKALQDPTTNEFVIPANTLENQTVEIRFADAPSGLAHAVTQLATNPQNPVYKLIKAIAPLIQGVNAERTAYKERYDIGDKPPVVTVRGENGDTIVLEVGTFPTNPTPQEIAWREKHQTTNNTLPPGKFLAPPSLGINYSIRQLANPESAAAKGLTAAHTVIQQAIPAVDGMRITNRVTFLDSLIRRAGWSANPNPMRSSMPPIEGVGRIDAQ